MAIKENCESVLERSKRRIKMGGLKMKIKKVKCNGCAREFEEDKITCFNGEKYLCHDCLVNIVNSRKSEMFLDNMPTVVTTDANQNRYITMMPENVKALYSMIIELEEYNKNISELISRIRNHMNYFKN